MPATGSCCCCCCWPFKKAASGKETPCYWRATATAAAAVSTKTRPRRFPGPERPFWNLLQKACYMFLAAGSLRAAALLPLRLLMRLLVSAAAYWCLLLPAAACCCLRLPAACCSLLLCPQRHGPPGRGNAMALILFSTSDAAVPTKTRPSRTGKHHGPEGRRKSKICVSRGRNVPSEIS